MSGKEAADSPEVSANVLLLPEQYTALLDDILSGLDPKTFEWIVNNCILGPQMKDRTVVLVSNNDKLLGRADMIVYMRDGTVSRTARPTKSENAVIENGEAVHSSPVSVVGVISQSDYPEGNNEPREENNEKLNDLDNLRGRIGFKYSKYLHFLNILVY
jgi:energy-coupling factor transporter ATP-binding protein EcfA2